MNHLHKSTTKATDVAISDELQKDAGKEVSGHPHKPHNLITPMEELQYLATLPSSVTIALKSDAIAAKCSKTELVMEPTKTRSAISTMGAKAHVMGDVTNERPRISAHENYLRKKVDLSGKSANTQCSGRFIGINTPNEKEAVDRLALSSAELIKAQVQLFAHIMNSTTKKISDRHSAEPPSAESSTLSKDPTAKLQADVQPVRQRMANSDTSFVMRELPFRCPPHTHVVKVTRASQRWIVRCRKYQRYFDFLASAPPVLASQALAQDSSHPGSNSTSQRYGQVHQKYVLGPYKHCSNRALSSSATPMHHQNPGKSAPTHTTDSINNYPFPSTVFLPQALPSYNYNTAPWGSIRAW